MGHKAIKIAAQTISDIKKLHAKGLTPNKIAAELGIHYQTAKHHGENQSGASDRVKTKRTHLYVSSPKEITRVYTLPKSAVCPKCGKDRFRTEWVIETRDYVAICAHCSKRIYKPINT